MNALGRRLSTQTISARLASGLTVVIDEVRDTDIAATCLQVGVGCRNEALAGAAHLIEHVLTEGSTDGYHDDEIVAGSGGSINAHTSLDHTQFTTVAPDVALESMLRIQVERLNSDRYGSAIVDAQKSIVEGELQRNFIRRPHGRLILGVLPELSRRIRVSRSHITTQRR